MTLTATRHNYHLTDPSPWPLTASLGAGVLVAGLVSFSHACSIVLMIMGVLILGLTATQWWRDVHREASFQGLHSIPVQWNMRWGMALFIISEVLFFFSFFWTYFHSSLSVGVESGAGWPPTGVVPFNPFSIPLLNTIILLASGLTVTWSHHAILVGSQSVAVRSLLVTAVLGGYFIAIQSYEYFEASFTMSDSVYGSCFFIATGFHGLHVIIGAIILLSMWARMVTGSFSALHHFGFEAGAWYWHFVDVVWVFLFTSVYWWGGGG